MNERTWAGVNGHRPSNSTIPAHPSQGHVPDPNDETSENSIRYWIGFSDFYQMPHITYYNSTDHLVNVLSTLTQTQLTNISELMKQYNEKAKYELLQRWRQILHNVARNSPNYPH